ncbi:hypothetical protein V6N13_063068 [Hibiscus sabdariffa]|uniref:Uncharacterized protein n=1 Tax=Hibiscus sabdariffa TaxID=183260 RepID=A0ABR2C442_9ROSI
MMPLQRQIDQALVHLTENQSENPSLAVQEKRNLLGKSNRRKHSLRSIAVAELSISLFLSIPIPFSVQGLKLGL